MYEYGLLNHGMRSEDNSMDIGFLLPHCVFQELNTHHARTVVCWAILQGTPLPFLRQDFSLYSPGQLCNQVGHKLRGLPALGLYFPYFLKNCTNRLCVGIIRICSISYTYQRDGEKLKWLSSNSAIQPMKFDLYSEYICKHLRNFTSIQINWWS